MKNRMFRLFTLAVCLVMVFTMFPVSADAAGNSYSTRSSTKVLLVFPDYGSLFSEPMEAEVIGNQKNGSIYYVPKPESGNGNLGTIKKGSKVTIFAEDNGYYFFMSSSGRMGWNKVEHFSEPEEYTESKRLGDSGLTTDYLDDIRDFIGENERAGGSNKFYPAKPIVIVKKGKTFKLTIYAQYKKNSDVKVWYSSYYLSPSWGKGSPGKGTINIKGKNVGSSTMEFKNYYTDREFNLLVIVV